MDHLWIIHGWSMDNLWIIYGKSIEHPWILYGYTIVLFLFTLFVLISWLHWKHHPSVKANAFLSAAMFKQAVPKEHVWTATSAKLALGGSIHHKDLILIRSNNAYKWQVARMEQHFEVQSALYSIVTFCTCIEYSFVTHSAQVQIQDQLQLIETESILCPVIYAEEQRAIRVLIPWAYRPSKD